MQKEKQLISCDNLTECNTKQEKSLFKTSPRIFRQCRMLCNTNRYTIRFSRRYFNHPSRKEFKLNREKLKTYFSTQHTYLFCKAISNTCYTQKERILTNPTEFQHIAKVEFRPDLRLKTFLFPTFGIRSSPSHKLFCRDTHLSSQLFALGELSRLKIMFLKKQKFSHISIPLRVAKALCEMLTAYQI